MVSFKKSNRSRKGVVASAVTLSLLVSLIAGLLLGSGVDAAPNADGDLDATFGGPPLGPAPGLVTTGFTARSNRAGAIVVQPDGKLVAAGGRSHGSDYNADIVLARLLPDGALDSSFGSAGLVTGDVAPGADNWAVDLALQSDARIVVLGTVRVTSSSRDFLLARYNSNGSLDASFGAGGFVTTDFTSYDMPGELVIQPDGKIVVAGEASGDFALARYLPTGALDPSFGSGGKVTTDFNEGSDGAFSVALQTDGKIVAGGGARGGLGLARYNQDGSLDTSFDGDGKVTTRSGTDSVDARALAIQDDGKIIIAGQDYRDYDTDSDFGIARFLPTGALDDGFGSGGKVNVDFDGYGDVAEAVLIQPGGKILVAGTAGTGYGTDHGFVRLTAAGAPDPGFGDGSAGAGKSITSYGPTWASVSDIAAQADGKFVAAGSATLADGSRLTVARYSADGALDPGFGAGSERPGIALIDFPGPGVPRGGAVAAVAVQPDGKIVAAGGPLVRYQADGSLDSGFGSGGVVHTFCSARDLALQSDGKIVQLTTCGLMRFLANGAIDSQFGDAGLAAAEPFSSGFSPVALALQSDGRLIVAGIRWVQSPDGTRTDFELRRYNSDGSPDTSFSGDGRVQTNVANNDSPSDLALQPDGKIVLAGGVADFSNNSDFALLRYLPDGSLDPGFGGDGIVTTDVSRYNEDRAHAVAIQPDGKVVAGGSVRDIEGLYSGLTRYTASGDLDPGFGAGGITRIDMEAGSSGEWIASVEVLRDGKIVAGGNAGQRFALARLLSNGFPDNSFGGDGVVVTDFGPGGASAPAMAIQADNRIVLAGWRTIYTGNGSQNAEYALARYLNSLSTEATATSTQPTSTSTVVPPTTAATGTATTVATGTAVPPAATATGTSTTAATSTPAASSTSSPSGTRTVVAATATATAGCIFSDVCPGAYFYTPVEYLVAVGAISGYGDNTFRPFNDTTRGQLSKIVVAAKGWAIDASGGPHFRDVAADNPFYGFIETAYNRGIISGYEDGTFRWGNNATRGQIAKIVYLAITNSQIR